MRRSLPLLVSAALLMRCGSSAHSEPRVGGARRERPAPTSRAPSRPAPPAPVGSSLPEVLPLAPATATALPAEIAEPWPLSVASVSARGRWIAACVARRDSDGDGRLAVEVTPSGALEGDALTPVLALSGAPLRELDDLFGFDPTGRYLVLKSGGRIALLDSESLRETPLDSLGFDDRDDAAPREQHRALAFDPRGELLAYVRRLEGRPELVLRTLSSGTEVVVSGAGLPYRMRWDATGETLIVWSLVNDTTGNGKLEWPLPLASGPRLRCPSPIPRLEVFPVRGDQPATLAVSRSGTEVRPAPDLAAPFGNGLLVRGSDAALTIVASGIRKQIAPAECGARVLHADPLRGLVLAACAGGKNPNKARVELLGAGYRLELGVEVQPTSVDRWPESNERVIPLYPGSDVLLVDLDARRIRPLSPGDQVLSTHGPAALIRRAGKLHVFDVESGAIRSLGLAAPRFASLLTRGALAAVGPLVIDLERGALVGRAPGSPLALLATGQVLIAEGAPPSAESLARGPLGFRRPVVAAPDATLGP